MAAWTKWRVEYSGADEAAFADPIRINQHFGLPLPGHEHIFSRSLTEAGLSNVHEPGKNFRPHYFGNTMVLRHIKQRHPDAWIWDERFRFTESSAFAKNERIIRAQQEFVRMMGLERIRAIQALAKAAGLDPEDKMVGRPDLAVYFPGERTEWRFLEIKIRKRGDRLRPEQEKWLNLLADFFGPESAIELELVENS